MLSGEAHLQEHSAVHRASQQQSTGQVYPTQVDTGEDTSKGEQRRSMSDLIS